MAEKTPYVIPLSAVKPKVLTLVPADPGSRYKTKQLQVQTVGKSKMIKSVFVNILEVAKSMQVPPAYIVHFLAYEIGAQAKFDAKKPERQQAILSGEHDPKELSRITVQFIQEVLLCPVCGLPEILIYLEKQVPMGNCRACGAQSTLPISNEKFKRYIINHPPTSKSAFGGNQTGLKKDSSSSSSKSKSSKKERANKEAANEGDDNDNVESDEEEEEEIVWHSDTSAEAARKRREQMMPDANLFKTEDGSSRFDLSGLRKVLESSSDEEALKKYKSEASLDDAAFISHLVDALYTSEEGASPVDIIAVTKSKSSTLSKLVNTPALQSLFLDSIERLIISSSNAKASLILKAFYDLDLIEEEVIVEWSKKKERNASFKEQIAPLIKWFEEAEEESDEEDDEEDEEDEE